MDGSLKTKVLLYQERMTSFWSALRSEGMVTEPFPGFGKSIDDVSPPRQKLHPDTELFEVAYLCSPLGPRLDVNRDDENFFGISGTAVFGSEAGWSEEESFLRWPFIPLVWDIEGNVIGLTRGPGGDIRLACHDPSPLYDAEAPDAEDSLAGTPFEDLPLQLRKIVESGEEMIVFEIP